MISRKDCSIIVIIVSLFIVTDAASRTRCNADGLATYRLEFHAEWSRRSFPKMYPLYRPPAQWSKLVGRSHDDKYSLWSLDTFASKKIKQFAENGRTSHLDNDAQGFKGVFDVFTAPNIRRGVGKASTKFFVDSKHNKVSVMVRIIPSPDWFVGIDSISLCKNNAWVDHLVVDLSPMDAGTDKGFTFSSPNWPAHEKISKITSQFPNHPANPFYYPKLKELPRIAHLVFQKVATHSENGIETSSDDNSTTSDTGDDEVPENNDVLNEIDTHPKGDKVTSLDCLVADWGQWSPCSKTCGFGRMTRHRVVIQEAQNGGHVCPPLTETEMCGSMRNCRWGHFKWGSVKRKRNHFRF